MSVESLMAYKPNRDRWGRPLIVPAGETEAVPYTRISTLAKALDKGEGLTEWKQRQTAVGLTQRPDLVALIQSAGSDKGRLDEACEQALVQAQSNLGANLGTALHSFTEQVDAGEDVTVPEELKADIEAYKRIRDQFEIVASEQFVVCDAIQAAGTYDRLVQFDGECMVLDIKTGQYEPRFPHGTAIQTATYAHGTPYGDKGRGPASLAQVGVSQTRALMLWLPSRQGKAQLFELDIEAGWNMAKVATGVRRWYKTRPIKAV